MIYMYLYIFVIIMILIIIIQLAIVIVSCDVSSRCRSLFEMAILNVIQYTIRIARITITIY